MPTYKERRREGGKEGEYLQILNIQMIRSEALRVRWDPSYCDQLTDTRRVLLLAGGEIFSNMVFLNPCSPEVCMDVHIRAHPWSKDRIRLVIQRPPTPMFPVLPSWGATLTTDYYSQLSHGELSFGLQTVESHCTEATYNIQPPACH